MICSILPEKCAPRLLSVLRIVAALLLLQHGLMKLFAYPAPMPNSPVVLFSLMGLAGILEFVGGILLALGLGTRIVAFILAGEMAVAYFMAHFPQNFFPALNGGELAVLYCFVFLYLAAAGGGAWALDNILCRKRSVIL